MKATHLNFFRIFSAERSLVNPFMSMRPCAIILLFSLLLTAKGMSFDPQPDLTGFKKDVAPFLERYCLDCHDDLTSKGGLSLHKVDPDVLFGSSFETWRMIEDQIKFGDMPPEDKKQPEGSERETILAWIRGELLKTQYPGVVSQEKLLLPQFGNYVDHQYLFSKRLPRVYPAPPRLWRLRPQIYEERMRTRNLEGSIHLANGLRMEDGSEIKDYAATYFIDEAGMSPLLGNAKKLAAGLLDSKRGKSRTLKDLVSNNGDPNEETITKAIRETFSLALGRQPDEEEQARFLAFYHKAASTGGNQIAAEALVTAILMQPEFFYRSELGSGEVDEHGRLRLSPSEIAYALSYALENAPVEEFLRAASEGKLKDAEAVREVLKVQIEEGTNPRIRQFFREYFHYPYANEIFKDPPEKGEHNSGMLIGDLEMTIAPILKEDREVLARLLTTRDYYVNAVYKKEKRSDVIQLVRRNDKTKKYQTAFNLPVDWKWSANRQPVRFAEEERAGILTHPAWLAAWSGNFENHPVQRGKWVRTHLLGGYVPDVPIGVDARVPEKEHTSFRDRLAEATRATECWRCHEKMDPLGLPFERYDHYGRYQRLDAGQPVDATGWIDRTGVPELDGRKVSGPTEMMELLSQSEHVEQVFVRHAFRFFLGRNETLGDANALQDAHRAYQDSEGSFNALVLSILSSDSFLYRKSLTNKPRTGP